MAEAKNQPQFSLEALMKGDYNPNYTPTKYSVPAGQRDTSSNYQLKPDGSQYWVGSDGNVWYRTPDGKTRNVGKPIDAYLKPEGFSTMQISAMAQRIPDPNPNGVNNPPSTNTDTTKTTTTTTPAPTGPGRVIPDKSASIALQMAGLAQVDPSYQRGITSIDESLTGLKGRYAEDSTRYEGNYGEQSTTNNQNLQKNKQTAMVNAAQGRRGLFGTLSSIGALNGSGVQLANQAVAAGANADLSGAGDTFSENQSNLDLAINSFRDDNKRRNDDADIAAAEAKVAAKNASALSRQKFYTQLANDYADMEQRGNSMKYANLAAAEYPTLTDTGAPNKLQYQAAAYTPSSLANYLAGAQSTNVETTPARPGGLPGLVATPRRRRGQQVTV